MALPKRYQSGIQRIGGLVASVNANAAEGFLRRYPKVRELMTRLAKSEKDLLTGYKKFLTAIKGKEGQLGANAGDTVQSTNFGEKTFWKWDWGKTSGWAEIWQYVWNRTHVKLMEGEVIGSTYQPFIDWCCHKMRITQRPRIHWYDQPFTAFGQPSFAMYDIHSNEIWICKGGRHPLDVMRSLGHELAHAMQRERGELTIADGKTGTKVENDANTLAGILMREWGRKNPRVYESVNEASQADSMVKAILQRFRGGRPGEKRFISMNTTGRRGAGEREVLKGLMGMFRDELTDIFKKLGLDKGWETPLTYR